MIFCVEDDSNIRELVIYTLETTGFKARGFEDGKEFLEALALETPELILLDIMLPGMDGLELLSKLKASPKNRDIPVIMLTAKGAEYDKVKALDAGADDYVTKPFSLKVLGARVKAILARDKRVRTEASDMSVKRIDDDLTIDFGRMQVLVRNTVVPLARKEYDICALLAKHPTQVFDRDMIYESVWGEPGDSSVVTEHVRRLRRALTEAGAARDYVRTVWGVGYTWGA